VLGDIADIHHETGDDRMLQKIFADTLHDDFRSVFMTNPESVGNRGVRYFQRPPEIRERSGMVFGSDQKQAVLADQFFGGVSGKALRRRTGIENAAVLIDDEKDVG